MQTLSVAILNPKAVRLLEDLADLNLISVKNQPGPPEAVTTFAFTTITHQITTYILTSPLRYLLETEDDDTVITCELLDLVGTGKTVADAKASFCQEFDFIYRRYNELGDDKLSARLRAIRKILTILVKNVERHGGA